MTPRKFLPLPMSGQNFWFSSFSISTGIWKPISLEFIFKKNLENASRVFLGPLLHRFVVAPRRIEIVTKKLFQIACAQYPLIIFWKTKLLIRRLRSPIFLFKKAITFAIPFCAVTPVCLSSVWLKVCLRLAWLIWVKNTDHKCERGSSLQWPRAVHRAICAEGISAWSRFWELPASASSSTPQSKNEWIN